MDPYEENIAVRITDTFESSKYFREQLVSLADVWSMALEAVGSPGTLFSIAISFLDKFLVLLKC